MSRSFKIDYNKNCFLMDDNEFRYVAGSFHYFRALPETWRAKLRTMRAAGLNAVDTYVEWSLHNPKNYKYDFEGIANIEKFIELAKEEDLYVILRPGPYICAERDNGGLPYWLFTKYPNIKVRTSDANFLREVRKWYEVLMPKLVKYFYGNGGPIIMVQIENEYGAFPVNDMKYLEWLRDETEKYTENNAVLFTTDIIDEKLSCSKIEGVLATTDFGADRIHEMDEIWKRLRTVQKNGPLVNSEFYSGWLTHWQEPNQKRDPDLIANALREILKSGASVSIYMFFGGTNFGFTAGANDFGPSNYTADITSYDYDAPMTEAGDPTIKYHKIRNVISEFLTLPTTPVPDVTIKSKFDAVKLVPVFKLLSLPKSTISEYPKTFEELDQFSGFVMYETILPDFQIDPTILTVNGLHDRALVYVDSNFVGTLARDNNINALPINAGLGNELTILVENQGRINFHDLNDRKGILKNVTIQTQNGIKIDLVNWSSTSIPLEVDQVKRLIEKYKSSENLMDIKTKGILSNGPVIFIQKFDIKATIYDTYLDMSGWGKGVVFINYFNLGRYWPLVGPQKTLYVPKEILKPEENYIFVLELQKTPDDLTVQLIDVPKLD